MKFLVSFLAACSMAQGSLIVYGDLPSWQTAVSQPIVTITFDVPQDGPYPAGYTEGGVLFEAISQGAANGYLYTNRVDYCAATGCLLGPQSEPGPLGDTDGYIEATFPGATNAVAFEAGAFFSVGEIAEFVFSNGDTYSFGRRTVSTPMFFGFVSDTPFSWVRYHVDVVPSVGAFPVIDTFYWLDEEVPEPATGLLLLTGLLAAGLTSRRRRLTR